MKPVDGDVLLAGALLGLDEPRSAVNADDQAARHLRIQGPGVASLLHPQDPLDPGDHLVRAGVGRLVEADEAGFEVKFFRRSGHWEVSSLGGALSDGSTAKVLSA